MGLSQPPKVKETCSFFGKDRLTKNQAKKLAKTLQRRGRQNTSAYQCRVCGGWHVGVKRK